MVAVLLCCFVLCYVVLCFGLLLLLLLWLAWLALTTRLTFVNIVRREARGRGASEAVSVSVA